MPPSRKARGKAKIAPDEVLSEHPASVDGSKSAPGIDDSISSKLLDDLKAHGITSKNKSDVEAKPFHQWGQVRASPYGSCLDSRVEPAVECINGID